MSTPLEQLISIRDIAHQMVEHHTAAAATAQQTIHEANRAITLARWDVKVGDIVRCTGRSCDGKLAKVTGLMFSDDRPERTRPWLQAALENQDGTFSRQSRNLYAHWEKA
jgi:hypothetical protein